MSQAGIVDFESSHPQVPTKFVTNSGTAIPIANTLEILATTVAAHSIPIETTGSGNMVTVVAQYASAAASSVAANAGFASFNSADFTVDANGYVTLSGSASVESFMVDAFTAPGTNPVVPSVSGVVTVTGGQVPAGTTANVIRTDSLAANTYTIQIQRSQAVASSTVGDNGVSHFNSTYFTVDSNGFVSLSGSGALQTVTGNDSVVVSPTAGNINFLTANATVKFLGTTSTETLDFGLDNLVLGTSIPALTFGSHNVGLGSNVLVSLTSGIGNTAIGNNSSDALTSGSNNVSVGYNSLTQITTGVQNTALGVSSLQQLTTSNGHNTAVGYGSLIALTTGNNNIALGLSAGSAYTTSEAYNICIGNNGVILDSNTIRIGTQFSAGTGQNECFIAGIVGVTVANQEIVTINSATGQMGVTNAIGETITGTTGGALSPTAGNWNILGSSTAAGTTPVQTSGSGSTLTVQVQKSQAIASTNATNVGLAAFNSTYFTVDSNGFVSLNGSGVGETITGNSGGALSPTAGNWNIVGTGSITTSGSGSTLTVQLTGLTNHAVLVGAGTATVTNVGPSATTGQVLQSQGSSTDPAFSTTTYPSTSTTGNLIYASATNVYSNLGIGSTGNLLQVSGGLPAWTAPIFFSQINVQTFTSSGTYTPTSGMKYCVVECIGAGGGGGGIGATTAGPGVAAAGGGAGGQYARTAYSAATVGASQTVTIGAGGTAGTNAPGNGGGGGITVFGSSSPIFQAAGGAGGTLCASTTSSRVVLGGAGSVSGGGGTLTTGGSPGGYGICNYGNTLGLAASGAGGSSFFGGGGVSIVIANSTAASAGAGGLNYGGGGSGAAGSNSSAQAGGAGAPGFMIITEYI